MYAIEANTLTVDTYLRRVAIWNGFEIVSTPAKLLMPTLRNDIPDFVTIGTGANARDWSTRNLDTPGVFVAHSSFFGRFYQWGTIGGVTHHWDPTIPGTGVLVSGWNNSNDRTAWTAAQEPCILARTAGSPNWRLPVGGGNNASDEFLMLLNASPFQTGSTTIRGQWITQEQARELGLGCTPGRLFGPNVNTVIAGDNVAPNNFNPNTMLFLPASGYRNNLADGALTNQGSNGYYWSSTANSTTATWNLSINSSLANNAFFSNKANGFSVRCISETVTSITQPNPASTAIPSEGHHVFNLAAATGGTGTFTYQWQHTTTPLTESSWVNISGATGQAFTTSALTAGSRRWFRRVATDTNGSHTTAAAEVTVFALRNLDTPSNFAANPQSLGRFYQWGTLTNGGASNHWPVTGAVTGWNNSSSRFAWTPANDPCPSGWRVPIQTELLRLRDNSPLTGTVRGVWTTVGGVDGRCFGPGAAAGCASINAAFFPAAGYRWFSSSELLAGTSGYYWSNIPSGTETAAPLNFSIDGVNTINFNRAFGFLVRCVAE
jgi:uncharacterized protein (TIGR02145 family)